MRKTHRNYLAILSALVLGMTFSTNAQDTKYVWDSYDGGGQLAPNQLMFPIEQATIVLDSPSSSDGSFSDVVSFSLSGWSVGGPYTYPSDLFVYYISCGTPFTWTPTGITDMDLGGSANFAFGSGITLFAMGMTADPQGGGSVDLENPNGAPGDAYDADGEWRGSPVPDVFSTAALLFLSLVILRVGRRYLVWAKWSCALVLGITFSTNAQDTKYVWDSYDGGGRFDPNQFVLPIEQATIVLDSPSSSGGSFSDVVSFSLSGETLGSFTYPSASLDYYISCGTPFTWTPTRITDMDLWVGANFAFGNGFTLFYMTMIADPQGGGSVYLETPNFEPGEAIDADGEWRGSPVPDVFSTAALLFLSVVILRAHKSGLRAL
jgi:hypothetical protein